ncbi:uncharacterized protein LOC127877922 isoform X1 [Dreissena polymorpha]|uniref:uncharacterized protein LOC127877922 isoform X1 n=1 Tax=Dreissena polymorpha TaxID=45954 RepID=UPI002265650C|nr:uncharacterized protein LOC127877922 isoform X1 [Dreissena polymorpha]XP_052280202.1 uncharacterized protein LOC127877922 isoform X1 [Dreissena polymorpha]XP_052280203.1 uncharacterized protein LOC127877922 isoform X1 [Dreissena polymorpha]
MQPPSFVPSTPASLSFDRTRCQEDPCTIFSFSVCGLFRYVKRKRIAKLNTRMTSKIKNKYYIHTDQRYNNVSDSYVYTQSLMNYAEVLLNIVTLFYHYRKSNLTKPLAFTVSVMTFWKTVLYIAMFYELAGGKDYRIGNTLLEEVLLVLIPNGIWLLLPGMCIVKLLRDMLCNRTDETVRLKVQ